MEEKKAVLSIGFNKNGTRNIEVNAEEGVSLETNATSISLKGVKQMASHGGKITHNSKKMIIIDNENNIKEEGEIMYNTNEMLEVANRKTAKNGGTIVTEVENGSYTRIGNEETAENNGKIINRVRKSSKVFLWITVLGVLADICTLIFTGKNVWELF